MKKQYAVFGLGKFGSSVAVTLEKLGCEVIAVDIAEEKVQEIADQVSYAMRADLHDTGVIQSLGLRNLDGAISLIEIGFWISCASHCANSGLLPASFAIVCFSSSVISPSAAAAAIMVRKINSPASTWLDEFNTSNAFSEMFGWLLCWDF